MVSVVSREKTKSCAKCGAEPKQGKWWVEHIGWVCGDCVIKALTPIDK